MSAPARDKIAVDLAPPARPPVTVADPMPPLERMSYPETTRALGEIQVEVGEAALALRRAWDKACTDDLLRHPDVKCIFENFLRFAVTFRPPDKDAS